MKTIFFAMLLGLWGCATFHAERLSSAKVAAGFESRTLENPGLEKFIESHLHREVSQWPPVSWDFEMLTLAALYYHPDMDVARAEWGVAEAEVITAGGRPNPAISLLGQHHSATAGGLSPWTFGFSLDIPVETAGKRGYRIQRAAHLSEAARLNIAETAWRVWSRLRKRLLDLYSSANREQFLTDRLAVQRETVALFEHRLAEGESSSFEATRSRLDLDKTRLLYSEAQKQRAEARASLADALGLQSRALDGVRISFDSFERAPAAIDLKDIRRRALLSRPDILAAISEYEASQSALQLEIARQYPDIHLGPGYEWDQGDNKWSLGFSVELPVFNRNQGPIEEAEARRKESAAKFAALQARVIGEVDGSQAAYCETLSKLQVADSLLSTELNHLQMIQRRFDLGESDRIELDGARMEFSSAELSRFEALVSAQENMGILEDAVRQQLSPLEMFPPVSMENPRKGSDK